MSASRNLLNYFLTTLRGHLVLLQLNDSTVYEGVFHTADIQHSAGQSASSDSVTLVIKQVQQQSEAFAAQHATSPRLQHTVAAAERNTAPFIAQRKFALSDIVQMRAVAVDFNDTAEGKKAGGAGKKGLSTDKEISNRDFQERELTRWEASSDALPTGSGGLEDEPAANGALTASGGRGWDQFSVHERMTGRQSTFDMDDYTTPLDKQSAHYRENLARAERIAREIERQGSAGNLHVAMERGQGKEEEVDEERLFSSVLDEAKGSKSDKTEKTDKSEKSEKAGRTSIDGKYVPPGRRREAGEAGAAVEPRKAKGGGAKEEEKEKERGVTESDKKAEAIEERLIEQKVAAGSAAEAKAAPGKSVIVEKEAKRKEEEKTEAKPEKTKKEAVTPANKAISSPSTGSQPTAVAAPPAAAEAVSQPAHSSSATPSATPTITASSSSSSSSSASSQSTSADSSAPSTAPPASAPPAADKAKAKSKLNPNAKSFSLSAAAKEFVPSVATAPLTAPIPQLQPVSSPVAPLVQPQPSLPMYGGQLPVGMQQQQPGSYGSMGMGMALMHPGVGVGGHMQFAGAMAAANGPRLMNGGMLPPGSMPMVGGQPLPAAYFSQQPYAMAPMQPQLLQPGLFSPQQQFGPFVPHPAGQSMPLGGGAARGGLNAAQQQQLTQHLMMVAATQQQRQQQEQSMHDPRFFNPQQPFQPQPPFNQQRF